MFRNYVTIALRNLWKRKGYAFINIFGLGLGLAASLLILLYARHELTYDRFHENADRIYQVYKERVTPTGTQVARDTWVPLLAKLEDTYPSVEAGARVWTGSYWIESSDGPGVSRRFREDVTVTDASLFDVFTFPLLRGDPDAVFADPQSVVITPEIAQKYFGQADPLGRTVRLDHELTYRVTGILAPLPSNSTLQIDLAVPWNSFPDYEDLMGQWDGSFLETYILLNEQAGPADLEAQFPALITDIWDAETAGRTNFKLEALPDLYDAVTGNRTYAFILIFIALAILLIACINFMNLATARSLERAPEIGMRKVLGAGRPQLARQFLGESVVLSLLALVVGVALAELFLRPFNQLYDLDLHLNYLSSPLQLSLLLGLGLVVGLLAGAYPALFVSGFRPIASLQGRLKGSRSGVRLRHALVVTQFALSILLIAGTLIVGRQIDYMKTADMNFDKENVVAVAAEQSDFGDGEAAAVRLETFKQELRQNPSVVSVSSSSHVPGDWSGWNIFARPEGWGDRDPLRVRRAFMDAHYFDTYHIDFLEGRPFSEDRPTDQEEALIINEAALQAFGWTTAEGKSVFMGSEGDQSLQVIGVVRDYNVESLQNEIGPVLHFYRPPENGVHNFISVRIRPENIAGTLAAMEEQWRAVDPTRPLPYSFVDDQFAQLYQAEERLGTMAGAFTVLGMIVACLGLFGLASWTATQRIKEIGIRKVLGASVPRIVGLLSRDFAVLVVIAFVLAVPVTYLAMQYWLADFAYQVPVGAGPFVLAGLLALAVALLTISYQSVKAALADPVQSLRYE